MKFHSLLYALPALVFASCSQGDSGSTPGTDEAGSPYLAKEVVGVRMLSDDQHAAYDEPCAMMEEGFIEGTFDLKETDELETLDLPNGCEFKWKSGSASISFGGPRAYPSVYHAEYNFDKKYQPGQSGNVSGQMGETSEKPALSGPDPEGTGAELPAITPAGPKRDTTANDSSDRVSGVTPAATQFAKPAVSSGKFTVIEGVGDKAVWEPAKNTLHVLYNNNIVNVQVETNANVMARQQKAASLANIVIDHLAGH